MLAEVLPALDTTVETPAGRWWTRYPARMIDWPPELRREAARKGWATRRAVPSPWVRLHTLVKAAPPALVRAYHLECAEALLPVYAALVPDDPRPATALWIMRRYAQGQATEADRLAARRLPIAAYEEYRGEPNPWHDAGRAALHGIGWSTHPNAIQGFRYALPGLRLAGDAATHLAALEARLAEAR